MQRFNVVSKESFSMLKFKKIDYKTSNMTTNGITVFASKIHSVMLSPLIEKLHRCCLFFDKLNHNAPCTESLIQITLGIYAVDVRGGIYFISTCCTCRSLINFSCLCSIIEGGCVGMQLFLTHQWKLVKSFTLSKFIRYFSLFSYFGFPPLQHIQSRAKWDTFKISCIN